MLTKQIRQFDNAIVEQISTDHFTLAPLLNWRIVGYVGGVWINQAFRTAAKAEIELSKMRLHADDREMMLPDTV